MSYQQSLMVFKQLQSSGRLTGILSKRGVPLNEWAAKRDGLIKLVKPCFDVF